MQEVNDRRSLPRPWRVWQDRGRASGIQKQDGAATTTTQTCCWPLPRQPGAGELGGVPAPRKVAPNGRLAREQFVHVSTHEATKHRLASRPTRRTQIDFANKFIFVNWRKSVHENRIQYNNDNNVCASWRANLMRSPNSFRTFGLQSRASAGAAGCGEHPQSGPSGCR